MAFVAGESLLDPAPLAAHPAPGGFAAVAISQQVDEPVNGVLAADDIGVGQQPNQAR